MATRLLSALVFAVLAGCVSGPPDRIEVKVPVGMRVQPPAELLVPVPPPAPGVFVGRADPRSVIGITEAGRRALVEHIDALRARDRAWRAWATEPDVEQP